MIDPQQFGEVKAKTDGNKERLDKFDTRFDALEKKLDRQTLIVGLNMIGGVGAMFYKTNPETVNTLISTIYHYLV